MHSIGINEYEIPRELMEEAMDRAIQLVDLGCTDTFDKIIKEQMHNLVVRSCWEYFRHRKGMK